MKVIQWGVGNVGRHSLRGILERPELELVGVKVYDPAKVGLDAGELVGADSVGIRATDDAEALIALDADCVLYNALGTTLIDLNGPTADLARLLESGKNVVSSAIDLFLYLKPGVAPKHVDPEMVSRLERACAAGGTTLYNTGMTPGFALDLWPITMTRVARRVDSIRVTELVSLRDYHSSMMAFMGFGLAADAPAPMYELFEDAPNSPYAATLHLIADALGAEIDEITYHREVATTPIPLDLPSGRFEQNTVVATRFEFVGWVAGTPFVTIEYVWRVTDDVAPDWPSGHCAWRLAIEGEPSMTASMELATELDSKRPTSLTVAMHSLNAVPAVVAAAPGIVNHLTLPLVAGRARTSLLGR